MHAKTGWEKICMWKRLMSVLDFKYVNDFLSILIHLNLLVSSAMTG